jgi:hypothetical protein
VESAVEIAEKKTPNRASDIAISDACDCKLFVRHAWLQVHQYMTKAGPAKTTCFLEQGGAAA